MDKNVNTENVTDNPFAYLDFTYEDAKEANRVLGLHRQDRNKKICVCGHGIARHSVNVRGDVVCKPSSMYCPCKGKREVLEVEDVRDFLSKTYGSGKFHALGRGLQKAMEKGHKVEWLIELKCDRCNTEGPISPVPVSKTGQAQEEATGIDALLCKDCRQSV